VIPLTSSYERFWLGLGAVGFDLMLASLITSLLRRHLSRKAWRAVHLAAYLSWPVAWFHSYFVSGDLQHGALRLMAIACALAVVAAALWRVAATGKDLPRAQRVGVLMTAIHSKAHSK
jgi:DMSO/TMAO reductase YedYZ heme-binding membrane subunit